MYRLLIVDDEPLIRSYMKSNLQKIHPSWEVCGEASDGAEALEFLAKEKVDLILTDVKMPFMNGLELCKVISLSFPFQKVVILSGHDEFAFAQEAMKYGVHEYLLKPINKQDFSDMLSRLVKQIEEDNKKEWTYNSLMGLSLEYQRQITCNYLRAIITNTSTEIKVLHPLLYKMKIDLNEAVCTVMILELDIESALLLKIPVEDIKIYQYILHQAAKETVQDKFGGYVFTDIWDNVIVYATGDHTTDLLQLCRNIYESVSIFIKQHTGITITGYMGQCRTEVLELNGSYTEAMNLIPEHVVSGGAKLFQCLSTENDQVSRLNHLEKNCTSLLSTLPQIEEPTFYAAVLNYINQIDPLDSASILRYAIYLLDQIRKNSSHHSVYRLELAIKHLIDSKCITDHYALKELVNCYAEAIRILNNDMKNESNETDVQSLAEGTREYILIHYSEPLSLAQIADNFGVSAGYLSKIFHETFGETYIKYLTRIRMEQAARLLKANPPDSILHIAEKTGYINQKHFCYVFKQYYNKTASEYQRGF